MAACRQPRRSARMLIGAHVSPAGGPAKAVERGVESGCRAIQIFNQSPRAVEADGLLRRAGRRRTARRMDGSRVDALLIHAIYLLNCATEDPEIRAKSLTSLIARRCGRATRSARAASCCIPARR